MLAAIDSLQDAAKVCKVGLGKMLDGGWCIVVHGALYQFEEPPTRGRERHQFRASVVRVGIAFDQTTIFKIVHGYRGGGCIAAGHIGQLLQGLRLIQQAPQQACTAEGQAGGIADFSAPFTAGFPYQVDHHLPDAIGFGAAVSVTDHAVAPADVSSSKCAAWRVVSRAQRELDNHASSNTVTPPPVISHQNGCEASAKPL